LLDPPLVSRHSPWAAAKPPVGGVGPGQKRVLLTGWCVAGRRAASVNARVSNGSAPTIGRIECAATAADSENCLAKLVRREGDALNSLLRRFDKAIEEVLAGGDPIDEIKDLSSRSQA